MTKRKTGAKRTARDRALDHGAAVPIAEAPKPAPRYMEIRRAIVRLPDATITLLASYRVITAPSKRVDATIVVAVDSVDPLTRDRLAGSSTTVASRQFKFGGQVLQDFAEVQAGNWLFERFEPQFEMLNPHKD